ncbi:MAG: hypothetical protein ACOCNI_03490, partial [Prevotella pectinovora]
LLIKCKQKSTLLKIKIQESPKERFGIKDRNKNPNQDPNDKLGSETSVRTKRKKTGNQVLIP